jgi:hypothetical protein
MLKQILIAALLLMGSDLCLGNPASDDETGLRSLRSIVILPSRSREPLQVTQRSFGESRSGARPASFGDSNSRKEDDSLIWGFVGSGIGFRIHF